MPLMTVGSLRQETYDNVKTAGLHPNDLFTLINGISSASVTAEVNLRNASSEFQSSISNYAAQVSNANADYRDAMAVYSTKRDLLSSDLSHAKYLKERLAPSYGLKIDYAKNLLITAKEQAELIDELPDPLDTLNLKRESHDATVSYTEELLNNLENQFGIQKQLLDRKYTKGEGQAQVQFNASGFGGIGMVQAIGKDIQAQKRLEVNLAEANKETEAIQKRYNISAAGIELKYAELQYEVDSVARKAQVLKAGTEVLDRQYSLDSLESEYELAQVEAEKTLTDLQTQSKYLKAPTRRQLGAAPTQRWVAGGASGGANSMEAEGSGFSAQTLGAFEFEAMKKGKA
jgi:ribosomal protein S8